MKVFLSRLGIAAFAFMFAGAAPFTGMAQTIFDMMPSQAGGGVTNRPPVFNADADSSFTAGSTAKFRGVDAGHSDAYNINLGASTRFTVGENWIVPFDLRSQNFYLDSLPGLPLPEDIHTLQFGSGLGYRWGDNWVFMGRVGVSLYKFRDVGLEDWGVSGGLTALWNYSPSLKFMFGIVVAPDTDVKALPLAGLNWAINDQWDLRLMFPAPRLTCRVDSHWSLFTGMNMQGATFRASNSLGNSPGLGQYDNALGTYRDIRLGAGVGYRLKNALRVELEGGYSVFRQIDYSRIDETVKFGPAPYVRAGLAVGF